MCYSNWLRKESNFQSVIWKFIETRMDLKTLWKLNYVFIKLSGDNEIVSEAIFNQHTLLDWCKTILSSLREKFLIRLTGRSVHRVLNRCIICKKLCDTPVARIPKHLVNNTALPRLKV